MCTRYHAMLHVRFNYRQPLSSFVTESKRKLRGGGIIHKNNGVLGGNFRKTPQKGAESHLMGVAQMNLHPPERKRSTNSKTAHVIFCHILSAEYPKSYRDNSNSGPFRF